MLIKKARDFVNLLHDIRTRLEFVQTAVGRVEARQLARVGSDVLADAEFKVFSQWGEDGIIQRLVRAVPIAKPVFVEFGVQDYTEANTRFLLVNNHWSGLVMDGDAQHIAAIRRSPLYWRHNLKAECAFIDRDNINGLIRSAGIEGDIGLLSVDIDGNDYWVWQAIDCVQPRILILEYNALFGPVAAISVPYDAAFVRSRAHYSNLFWGASLEALTRLSKQKGYALVGCNSAGNNAFYVRQDVLGSQRELGVEQAFVQAQFRESRDSAGTPTFLDVAAARALVGTMVVYDLDAGGLAPLKQCLGGD